jgi:hypothetical protein
MEESAMEALVSLLKDSIAPEYVPPIIVFVAMASVVTFYYKRCQAISALGEGDIISYICALFVKLTIAVPQGGISVERVYEDLDSRRKLAMVGHRRLLVALAWMFRERGGFQVAALLVSGLVTMCALILGQRQAAELFVIMVLVLAMASAAVLNACARELTIQVKRLKSLAGVSDASKDSRERPEPQGGEKQPVWRGWL